MRSRAVGMVTALAMLCALAACGSGVDEVAATTTYNARFVGLAYYHTPSTSPLKRLDAALSLSQLASTVTGTIDVVDSSGAAPDTLLSAGVTGHTTPDGIDLTIVRVTGCARPRITRVNVPAGSAAGSGMIARTPSPAGVP